VLAESAWDHTLTEEDGTLVLSVVCGRVAVFETTIELTPSEASAFRRLGIAGIQWLIDDVRDRPDAYRARHDRFRSRPAPPERPPEG